MAETVRAFAEGDSVISTRCLIAPPDRIGGVRIELPLASRGTVLNAWSDGESTVCLVVFEVGEGGVVEMDVTEDQIARVRSHGPIAVQSAHDLPPLVVKKRDHVPTLKYPHAKCRAVHTINVLLMFVVYGIVLSSYPLGVLLVTVCFMVVSYIYDYRITGEFSWFPEVLKAPGLEPGERIVPSQKHLKYTALTDVLVTVSLVALISCYFVNINTKNAVLFVILCAASLVSWAAKAVMHIRAVQVVTNYDD